MIDQRAEQALGLHLGLRAGEFARRHVEQGAARNGELVTERRIEAGDLANPGMLLLAVYDPSRMRLEAPVPVRLLDRLAVGQSVEVTLDRPAKVFPGTVSEIVSEVDPASRTQLVKIHLDVADGDVLPGTFGRLWVDAGPREVIAIPSSAVIRVGQLEFVQAVRDGRVVRRLVKTGPARDTSVEILSGLSAGDVILVNRLDAKKGDTVEFPVSLVVDGDKVTLAAADLAKVSVKAEVVNDEAKGPKISIQKYKNKTGVARRKGHRQKLTIVKITAIA